MDMDGLEQAEQTLQAGGAGQGSGGDVENNVADGPGAGGTWTDEEWREWNRNSWYRNSSNWTWGRDSWSTSYQGDPWQSYATYTEAAQTEPAGQTGSASAAATGGVDTQLPHGQRDRGHQDWGDQNRWWNSSKGDFSDPPAWGGWPNYRLWKKAVSRWHAGTDVALWRRGEKLLKGFDWEMQSRFDHLSDSILTGPNYLTAIFEVMDALSGEKESSEKRRSIRAALYEGTRKADESLSQYSLRRESQFLNADRFLSLPDELKAFMLEEQSGLTAQGIQNLRVLTGGRHSYDDVRKALRIMDTEDESLFKANKKSNFFLAEDDVTEEHDSEEDDDADEIFLAIENEDMTEDAVMSFLADWDSKKKKRTWAESKQLKAARRKDRRHFEDPGERAGKPRNRRNLSTAELKKITRCANCLQKGHWHEECKNPYKPRPNAQGFPGASGNRDKPAANAFVFTGLPSSSSAAGSSFSYVETQMFGASFAEKNEGWNYLTVPPGMAIVDPGASQDLIGEKAFGKLRDRLREVGLQPVILPEKPSPASGVGGDASPLFSALTPCVLGGYPGIIKLTVLREDIPQLLSIGLLELGKAVIDTDLDVIDFKAFGSRSHMTRLESGHRLIDVAEWPKQGQSFKVPDQVLKDFHLRDADFRCKDSSSSEVSAYMAAVRSEHLSRDTYFHYIESKIHENDFFQDMLGNSCLCHSGDKFDHHDTSVGKFRTSWVFCEGCWFLVERHVLSTEPIREYLQHLTDFRVFSVWFHEGEGEFIRFLSDVPVLKPSSCKTQNENETKTVGELSENLQSFTSKQSHVQLSGDVSSKKELKEVRFDNETLREVLHENHVVLGERSPQPNSVLPLGEQCVDHVGNFGVAFGLQHEAANVESFQLNDGQGEKRGGLREGLFHVAASDHQAALHEEDPILPDHAGDPQAACDVCEGGMPAPINSSSEGCQPVREVGQMQSVRNEAIVREVLGCQSSYQSQEGCQVRGGVSASDTADEHGSTFGQRKEEDGDCLWQSSGRSFESRSSSGSSTADRLLGGWDQQGTDAIGAESTGSAGYIGAYDAPAADSTYDADAPAASNGDASAKGDTNSLRGRGDEQQYEQSQLGELGESVAAVTALASVLRHFEVSHLDFPDLKNWLAASLSPSCCVQLARRGISNAVIWQPDVYHSFVLWSDVGFVDQAVGSDDFDDHEFQVTRRDKRSLLSVVQNSLFTGKNSENSQRHFDGAGDGDHARTPRKDQQCGEDARTSRQQEEHGEDVRTSRTDQQSGEDARTSRNGGEDARTSVGKRSEEQDNIDINWFVGFPGHVSLLRLPLDELSSTFHNHGSYKVCELFSPPRVTPVATSKGFTATSPPAFDKTTGWDFFNAKDRACFWRMLHEQQPDLVIMSPVCRAFSIMMCSNYPRMDPAEAQRIQAEGMAMLHFCVQVAEFQLAHNRHYLIEHPGGASSWQTHSIKWLLEQIGTVRFLFDQCAVGLSVDVSGQLSQKVTGIITNHMGIASVLSQHQCSRDHQHVRLENGRPRLAQVYPDKMISELVRGMSKQLNVFQKLDSFPAIDGDGEEAADDAEEAGDDGVQAAHPPISEVPITQIEKDKVKMIHCNMGHISRSQMINLLKAAGGKPQVLRYVRDEFSCPQCLRQQRPISRRKAAFPRVFSFNRIVGVDFFYISWDGKTLAFLNIVCHGTNLQQVGWLQNYDGGAPNSKETWNLFSQLWVRPFGLPEVLISDGGGEFRYEFERSAEQSGIMQVVTDAASPWQNGRAERHGGWVKTRLEQEIQSGECVVQSVSELEQLVISLVSHKNRWYHRGGFSPYQLTFGANPRIPLELLSDDSLQEPAISDVTADAFEQDSAAAEFSRSHAIRQRARQLCMRSSAKDKVRLSSQGPLHRERQWFPGQWVFVWRRFAGTGQGHVTRSRWTGPGLVLQQDGHTVWVSMRARLLKCNSDQLRAANHEESVGAELLRAGHIKDLVEQTSSHRAGAIDVGSEGSPPSEAWEGVPVPEVLPLRDVLPGALQDETRLHTIQESVETILPPTPVTQPTTPAPRTPIPRGVGTLARGLMNPPVQPEGLHHGRRDQRRLSTQTLEEPLLEPPPSRAVSEASGPSIGSIASADNTKRRKTDSGGRVQKHIDDIEATELKRLERIAAQTIRQMDREERKKRAATASAASSSSAAAAAAASSSPQTSAPPIAVDTAIHEGANAPEEDPDEDIFLEASQLNFFQIVPNENRDALLVKKDKKQTLRNSEFNMKEATPEERRGFEDSDLKEWQAIVDMGAVQVINGEAASRVRRELGHRIITSRMIRRKKPVPGVGNYKFKSRWCVHGHRDPDADSLQTYSPMPSTESITLFFQTCLNLDLKVSLTDISNAFCQSNKLDRPDGPLFVKPCSGLNIPEDSLIELVVPVYGLNDAPIRWHHTLLQFFEELGFKRSLLEPCWLTKRVGGKLTAQVLIEVDDINIGATAEEELAIKEKLEKKFKFGKWESGEADFAGRHVKFLEDRVCMDQEKYILEKLIPYKLPRGRLSDKTALLIDDDFEAHRSLLYRVNWVAHQTRPEVAGVVSLLSSRLKQATIHDLCCLNKAVQHLRSTAQQSLTLHKFRNDKMVFIAASDAGGVDSVPIRPDDSQVTDTVQGAWVIMGAERMPSASRKTKVSILSWRSAKLKRRVSSTLAGEALAFSQSLGEMEWLQIMFRDVCFGDVCRKDWQSSLLPFIGLLREDCLLKGQLQSSCAVTDAKSLYDAVQKQNTTSRQDRRTSVELAIITETMNRSQASLRWTPHPRMIADALTKDDLARSNGALEELLRTGLLSLWNEDSELEIRRSDPKSKGRSKKASERFRESNMNLLTMLGKVHINKDLWELLK